MTMKLIRTAGLASLFAALSLTGSAAFAEMVGYKADLNGASEVPANDTKGMGMVEAMYDSDSHKLSWTITYDGLTGPAAAAHFHGPAMAGANAPPVVPLSGDLKSPIKGEAMLTEAQAADLAAGKLYFNIHTAANKGGEVRGQLMKK